MGRAAFLVVVLSAALAGCGGDDAQPAESGSTEDTSTAEVSRDDFVGEIENLCQEFAGNAEDVEERVQAAQEGTDVQEAGDAYREAADLYEDFADSLEDVEEPSDGSGADELADAVDETSDLLQREADAVERGDVSAASTIATEISNNTARIEGISDGIGIDCLGRD